MNRTVILFTIMLLFSLTASAQSFNKQLEKRAKAGDVQAQYEMGKIYQGDKDKKALKWYQKAAEQGHADACYEMAQLCIKGVLNDDPSMWLLKAAENGNDDMKMRVVNQLSSLNQIDKASEVLISMGEKGDNDIKMQVVDRLLSIDERSKAIILLKSCAKQSKSFSWTQRIIKKIISIDGELIHQPEIQELFCSKAKEQYEREEYNNAYATLYPFIDESDSPAKQLLSELKARQQAIKDSLAREQARKDSLARQFAHGAWYDGPVKDGVPCESGTLYIPYQGQTILVKISDFASRGAPYRGKIYAFGNEFNLNSSGYYSNIKYGDSWFGYLITEYKYKSMNTFIAEIIKNVDKLKNAKTNLAKQKADQEKRQREEEQWKKTHYHSTPKEVMCFYCAGQGYIEARDFDGSLQKRWRCTNCYGRGYTLEHYY